MGCTGSRENLEDQILLMRLDRMEVQMMKELELKKLSENHGVAIKKGFIPDYIDPDFAKENNIYEDDEYMLNNNAYKYKDKERERERDKDRDRDISNTKSEIKRPKKSKSSKDVRTKTEPNFRKKKKSKKDRSTKSKDE